MPEREEEDEVTLESLERKYGIARESSEDGTDDETDPLDEPPEGWAQTVSADSEEDKSFATRAMRAVLWVAAVLGALYVASVFWDGLEAAGYNGDNGARWLPLVGLVVVASAVFALLWSNRNDEGREALKPAIVLVLLVLGVTGFTVYQSRGNNDQLVRNYCSYGATSVVQWIRCVESVKPGQVIYSDTAAADFANGKAKNCGAGAGPFCGEAAKGREAREALGELEEEERWP